jgi:hypothetical protein
LLDKYLAISAKLIVAIAISCISNVIVCSGKRYKIHVALLITSIAMLFAFPLFLSYMQIRLDAGPGVKPTDFIHAIINVFTPGISLSSAFIVTLLSYWGFVLFPLAIYIIHYYSSTFETDGTGSDTRPPFKPRRVGDVFHHFILCRVAFVICLVKLITIFIMQPGIDEDYALLRIGWLSLNVAFCVIGGSINTQIVISRMKPTVLLAGCFFSDFIGLSIIFVNCCI